MTYGERAAVQIDRSSEFGCCIHDDRRVHFLDRSSPRPLLDTRHAHSLSLFLSFVCGASSLSSFLSLFFLFSFSSSDYIPRTESFFSGSRKRDSKTSRKAATRFFSKKPPQYLSLSLFFSLSLSLARSLTRSRYTYIHISVSLAHYSLACNS